MTSPGRIKRTYSVLVPVLIALFLLSRIDDNNKPHTGFRWDSLFLGLFGAVVAVTMVFSAVVVVVGLARRRS